MASHRDETLSTPSPVPTSQSQESSVPSVSVIGQSGPPYQSNIYHPHVYPQFYNQGMPYTYNMQPTVITQPAALPVGPVGPTAPTPMPHSSSEPSAIPAVMAGEEAKPPLAEPVPGKQGPGPHCKQPVGETTSGTGARKPAQKGHMISSQNWSALDLKALAHYVKEALPLGINVWKRIKGQYNNEYAIPNNWQERGWDNIQCHDPNIASDYLFFSFVYPSLVPLSSHPLFLNWTHLCLLIRVDSRCTIVTHPRTLVLGYDSCTMTHGLTLWLTFVCVHIL